MPESDIALRGRGISKAFGATQALADVSFDLTRGSVHVLLGGNGSGKSTLIKILAGVEPADAGEVELAGTVVDLRSMTPARAREAGLHFVHQQRSVFPDLSIAENLAIGRGFDTAPGYRIRWRQARKRASRVLDRFQIEAHADDELGSLGPATQTMVAIARALQDQEGAADGLLLLDEPTASLPDTESRLLLSALRRYAEAGQTIVYVTHRLEEVFAIADRVTVLRDGRVVDTVSPATLTHDTLVELIMGRAVQRVERLRGGAPGPMVLRLTGVSAGPLRPLDLELRGGEIVGIAGLIGSGRSSLLKALFGALPLRSGLISLNGAPVHVPDPRAAMAAGFAYIPEDRADSAFPDLSLKENLSVTALQRYWRAAILNQRVERRDADELRSAFLIKAESVDAPLQSLSGGNQQKAILARWLRRNPPVLLLDEPTQGVDVGARAEIYEILRRATSDGAGALLVSSDFEELAAVCSRALVLRKGKKLGELAASRGDLTAERLQQLAHAEVEGA